MQQTHLQNEEEPAPQVTPAVSASAAELQAEETLRNERVTEREAQQIVHLWAEMQRQAPPGGPTVSDIAEGLEIPPEEAHRLLQQVRNQERIRTRAVQQTRKRLVPAWTAVIVAMVVAIILAGLLTTVRSMQTVPPPAEATVAIEAPREANPPPRTQPPPTSTQPADSR